MPGEFFFLAFGGLGISLAGFAGLIFVLDRRPIVDNPISRWRIRHIALTGLLISTAGLLVLPVYQLTSDVAMTVRLVSVFVIVVSVIRARIDLRPGTAWPDERRRMFNIGLAVLTLAMWIANLAVGSVAFMMLLFVVWISAPIGTFANAIQDLRIEEAPQLVGDNPPGNEPVPPSGGSA